MPLSKLNGFIGILSAIMQNAVLLTVVAPSILYLGQAGLVEEVIDLFL
jgi:hypothetical protein